MSWDWPVISYIKKKLSPEPEPTPVDPTPAPEPPRPDPAPEPEPPLVEPSRLNSINYLRALLLLRNTPFKQLWIEFLKLPLKQLAYTCGVFVWLYMTYVFIVWAFWRLFQ